MLRKEMFPRLLPQETFATEAKFASREAKMFLNSFRNILLPRFRVPLHSYAVTLLQTGDIACSAPTVPQKAMSQDLFQYRFNREAKNCQTITKDKKMLKLMNKTYIYIIHMNIYIYLRLRHFISYSILYHIIISYQNIDSKKCQQNICESECA